MNSGGLIVDAQAIGAGLYAIIERDQKAHLVAFGMIPVEIIEMCESLLKEKVIELKAKELRATVDEVRPFVDRAKVDEIVRPIIREVSHAIYAAAAKKGKMIV